MFKNFHQSIYRYVESSSVTPYSKGSRDKNIEAIFVGLAKVNGVKGPGLVPSDKKYTEEAKIMFHSAYQKQNLENLHLIELFSSINLVLQQKLLAGLQF